MPIPIEVQTANSKRNRTYTNMPKEIWKDIPDWPYYKISSLGRIKSFVQNNRGRILSTRFLKDGKYKYSVVTLCSSGQKKQISIPYLILTLFGENFVDITGEQWKPVTEWNGYEVSNMGRVRARGRVVKKSNGMNFFTTGRIKNLRLSSSKKYLCVNLSKDGVFQTMQVHRLVATAFVAGRTSQRKCVNHKDGNGLNNFSDNLEWVTHKENSQHSVEILKRHGGCKGEKNNGAKLTEQQAIDAKRMFLLKQADVSQLARKFGIHEKSMYRLVTGRNWKHLS